MVRKTINDNIRTHTYPLRNITVTRSNISDAPFDLIHKGTLEVFSIRES